MNMTAKARIDELHGKTTQGEWRETYTYAGAQHRVAVIADGRWVMISDKANDPNAAFIAAIHNAWPEISKEMERLTETLAQYQYAAAELAGANSSGMTDNAIAFIRHREAFRALQRRYTKGSDEQCPITD